MDHWPGWQVKSDLLGDGVGLNIVDDDDGVCAVLLRGRGSAHVVVCPVPDEEVVRFRAWDHVKVGNGCWMMDVEIFQNH